MNIILNGRRLMVMGTTMTYDEIVRLANTMRSPHVLHTVTYFGPRRGDCQRSGSVIPGETLELEEGMVISAVVMAPDQLP